MGVGNTHYLPLLEFCNELDYCMSSIAGCCDGTDPNFFIILMKNARYFGVPKQLADMSVTRQQLHAIALENLRLKYFNE